MKKIKIDTDRLYDDLFDYHMELQKKVQKRINQEQLGEHFELTGEIMRQFDANRKISWNSMAVICMKMGKNIEDYLI